MPIPPKGRTSLAAVPTASELNKLVKRLASLATSERKVDLVGLLDQEPAVVAQTLLTAYEPQLVATSRPHLDVIGKALKAALIFKLGRELSLMPEVLGLDSGVLEQEAQLDAAQGVRGAVDFQQLMAGQLEHVTVRRPGEAPVSALARLADEPELRLDAFGEDEQASVLRALAYLREFGLARKRE